MTVRTYLVPSQTLSDGKTTPAYVRPQDATQIAPIRYDAIRFGVEPTFMVRLDVTNPQHTALMSNSPITAFPQNLDAEVGGNRAVIEAALEGWNIPGDWVTTGMTYRQVRRVVATIFAIACRLFGLHGVRTFPAEVNLNTTVAQMGTTRRDMLADVFDSFGWDRSWVAGSTTMRQLLYNAAQQWSGPLNLGSAEL